MRVKNGGGARLGKGTEVFIGLCVPLSTQKNLMMMMMIIIIIIILSQKIPVKQFIGLYNLRN